MSPISSDSQDQSGHPQVKVPWHFGRDLSSLHARVAAYYPQFTIWVCLRKKLLDGFNATPKQKYHLEGPLLNVRSMQTLAFLGKP